MHYYCTLLRFLLLISSILLVTILHLTSAGYSSGPGTDPYGFGNVAEICNSPISVTQYFSPTWTIDHPELHYVMISKEQLTRLTQNLHHSVIVDPIRTEDIRKACFTSTQVASTNGANHTVTGFGSLSLNLFVAMSGYPRVFHSDPMFPLSVPNLASMSFSNRETFVVTLICHDDGVAGWVVNSPNWSISDEDIYAVSQHLLSLGFNMDHAVILDNSNCGENSMNSDVVTPMKPHRKGNKHRKGLLHL